MTDDKVVKVVAYYEDSDIYDGYSVIEYEDGTFENRWADPADPTRAREFCDRRFEKTEAYIAHLKRYQRHDAAYATEEGR